MSGMKKIGKYIGHWKMSFACLRENGISHSNFFKQVELIMCVSGTNAPTERWFSVFNNIWTAEKTQILAL